MTNLVKRSKDGVIEGIDWDQLVDLVEANAELLQLEGDAVIGGLVDKSGEVNTESDNETNIIFNTPYPDTDYFIMLTAGQSTDAIILNVKTGTKTVSGFTVVSRDDSGKAEKGVDVYWATGPYSNP